MTDHRARSFPPFAPRSTIHDNKTCDHECVCVCSDPTDPECNSINDRRALVKTRNNKLRSTLSLAGSRPRGLGFLRERERERERESRVRSSTAIMSEPVRESEQLRHRHHRSGQ